jgi:hypothetical protein
VIEDQRPDRIVLSYNYLLANIIPPASSFTVNVNGSTTNVSTVNIDGYNVILTLSSGVAFADIVTLSFVQPMEGILQSETGLIAASLTDVQVINLILNKPPSVRIVTPVQNTAFTAPAAISIEATAKDQDGSITKVMFFSGDYKIGEKNSPPYSVSWDDAPVGTHSLTAVAIDNNNATSVSSVVKVNVSSENKYDELINLTPNPNDGNFYIDVFIPTDEKDYEVIIANVLGQVIHRKRYTMEQTSSEFDISGATNGIYIAMVRIGDKIISTRKFIKQ